MTRDPLSSLSYTSTKSLVYAWVSECRLAHIAFNKMLNTSRFLPQTGRSCVLFLQHTYFSNDDADADLSLNVILFPWCFSETFIDIMLVILRCKFPIGAWSEAASDKRFGAYWSQTVQLWWQQFLLIFLRINVKQRKKIVAGSNSSHGGALWGVVSFLCI